MNTWKLLGAYVERLSSLSGQVFTMTRVTFSQLDQQKLHVIDKLSHCYMGYDERTIFSAFQTLASSEDYI